MPEYQNHRNSGKARHKRTSPCPICGGWDQMPRGKGLRCHGFTAGDIAMCSREEKAGSLSLNPSSGAYLHKLKGKCSCGVRHGPETDSSKRQGSSRDDKIIVAYDYRDARRELLYQVVRKNPKGFFQRWPDGKGGWLKTKPKHCPWILYRLPELLNSEADDAVHVVEGERDVEALRLCGLVATCNPMGAGKWQQMDQEPLRNRIVVVIPDHDDEGRRHAADVASSLTGVASSVDVKRLEGPHKGYDVSDWLADGHDVGEIAKLPSTESVTEEPGTPLYLWWKDDGDYTVEGKWEDSLNADCLRAMRQHAKRLCVVKPRDGSLYRLMVVESGGTWTTAGSALDDVISATAQEWAMASVTDPTAPAAVVSHFKRALGSYRGREEALRSVGAIAIKWRRDLPDYWPDGLEECEDVDLDIDRRYIGALNGVIDIDTGKLLTGMSARACRVTRRVPLPFAADASHELAAKLLEHLGREDREYLIAAVGFALRRGPGKCLYFLRGERNGGKSTFLKSVVSVLGDVRQRGYGMAIDGEALLHSQWANPHGHQGGIFGIQNALIAVVSELPERKAKLDVGLLKKLDGITPLSVRDVGKKAGSFLPAKATLFVALNPPDIERLDLMDDALESRVRILPYPSLPSVAPGFEGLFEECIEARQALLLSMIKAACAFAGNNWTPPGPPDSVRQAVQQRRDESIGEVGQWLVENLEVTGYVGDKIGRQQLFDRLAESIEKDGLGKYAGMDEREVLNHAKKLFPYFPKQKKVRVGGASINGYAGVCFKGESHKRDDPALADYAQTFGEVKLITGGAREWLSKLPDEYPGNVQEVIDTPEETIVKWRTPPPEAQSGLWWSRVDAMKVISKDCSSCNGDIILAAGCDRCQNGVDKLAPLNETEHLGPDGKGHWRSHKEPAQKANDEESKKWNAYLNKPEEK